MASRSFFSPRSTVKAITSQPCSFSQRIATEVSRPPEYARTTFSAGIGEELLERLAGARSAQHGDDRVVAGDGPHHSGQRSFVDAARDQVGGAGRGPDHRHGRNELDREDELAHQRRRAAIPGAGADEPELLDVA